MKREKNQKLSYQKQTWEGDLFKVKFFSLFSSSNIGRPHINGHFIFNFYLINTGRLPQNAACRYARPIYFQQAYDKNYFFDCKIFLKETNNSSSTSKCWTLSCSWCGYSTQGTQQIPSSTSLSRCNLPTLRNFFLQLLEENMACTFCACRQIGVLPGYKTNPPNLHASTFSPHSSSRVLEVMGK